MEYSDHQRKWLWLYAALCPAVNKFDAILQRAGMPEYVFDDPEIAADGPGDVKLIKALRETRSEQYIDNLIADMERRGITFVCRDDYEYPETLCDMDAFIHLPAVLFIRGSREIECARSVAIVGTRSADRSGMNIARGFARAFAENDVTVISGFAVGIDAAAAEGALDGGGRYIGVLGCGVDVPYPAMNQSLLKRALDSGGTFISEYMPGMRAMRAFFPARNRIIAAMAMGTLLIQAPERSGALNTARQALDYGRELFVVPGGLDDRLYAGSNQLLRDCSNIALIWRDVLEIMGYVERRSTEEDAAAESRPAPALNDDELAVVRQLNSGNMSYDALIAATGMSAAKLSTVITMLKLKGAIEEMPGRQYGIARG